MHGWCLECRTHHEKAAEAVRSTSLRNAALIHPDFILVKRPRNKDGLRCSHRGGTDHGGVKNLCLRRGMGSSASGSCPPQGLSHPLLLSLPVVLLLCRQPKKPFKNLPREACIESDG